MRVLDFSSAPGSAPGDLTPLPLGTAACLGAFDGMHRGHQGLIARARALAPEVAVVTFEPRPAEVLAPERAPPRLQTPSQREHVCRELGVDTLAILRFDAEVSRLSPAAFAQQVLIEGLRPVAVVVGYDFRFGARRAGGPDELRRLLAGAGIGLSVVEKISEQDGEKLGSTAIRELVGAGQVEHAAELLGRLYSVAGVVEHGAGRGRGLGYPTANVKSHSLRPRGGVYACFLSLRGRSASGRMVELESWPAVANLGTNPTFASTDAPGPTTLEVHALDVDLGERLYGREVEVAFVARLRDEQRFDGVEALREAIAADIEAARPLLSEDVAARRHASKVEAEPASLEPEPRHLAGGKR
ncbi:Riboflavin biosynthesis protein RibF [Enhygromyxa salina]|uniref:Riboflavin biosynthesis protein n=1 Tax=Enhygromyxa salina TaxID=215803 RepID=A0A2S9YB44_9BACT|nr:riboflavin biosynthesis protein RibF [Enhygromyxa salina]PRQ02226.1 Riboflavin biosynthesis protein RibF [Enhygromyxa salina]